MVTRDHKVQAFKMIWAVLTQFFAHEEEMFVYTFMLDFGDLFIFFNQMG